MKQQRLITNKMRKASRFYNECVKSEINYLEFRELRRVHQLMSNMNRGQRRQEARKSGRGS